MKRKQKDCAVFKGDRLLRPLPQPVQCTRPMGLAWERQPQTASRDGAVLLSPTA
jgi:hypothetical protein